MEVTAGSQLGHYEVVSQLGAGGMGKIYLAQDKRLGRKVALKLLPAEFTNDEQCLLRFQQEARAASALNHPNIITVHDIGQVNSAHFIATEFIEGETLRNYIARGGMKLRHVLEVATQVAAALAAAHTAGIVHRDIKPDNIMLRPDGYVKVLDFGLAKLTEKAEQPVVTVDSDKATRAFVETEPGTVMGTVTYMSPEQTRGLPVDARTDIFSLGVVLYEMIAGQPPFMGATTTDVIIAIVEREPLPLAHYAPAVPAELQRIVSKALRKDREERYQTVKDLALDLKSLKQELELAAKLEQSIGPAAGQARRVRSKGQATLGPHRDMTASTGELDTARTGSTPKYISQVTRTTTRTVLALAVLAAAAGLATLGLVKLAGLNRSTTKVSVPFQSMRLAKLTTSGRAIRAAISPDGKYVVHVMSDAGQQSLWVGQVATTNNVQVVAPAEVFYRGLTFSHDGNYINYVVQERNNPIQILYQVPVLGGTPRKLLVDIDSPVTLSPDGSRMAFIRRIRSQGEDALIVANADGTGERKLAARKGPDFLSISGPGWSPDGERIAFAAGSNAGGRHMQVIEVGVADGAERPVCAQRWFDVGRVVWVTEGKGLVVSATNQGATTAQVWHISYPGGEAQKVTNDLNDYRDLSLTADSGTLVTIQSEARVNIWVAPGGDAARAKQITTGVGQYNGVRGISWAPDGRIAYVSRASSSQDIWIMDPDGGNQKQLTTVATLADVNPTVTADGRHIVFTSSRTGNSNVWRIELDGGNPTQLTSGVGEEFPHASPAGPWVVYTDTGSNRFTLWKVPVDGGQPVQLTDRLSQWPVVSPDGKLVACWYRDEANSPWRIAVIPFAGGPPVKVFDVAPTAAFAIPVRWTADGRALTYVNTSQGASNIWSQPLDGGAPRPVTDFKSDQIFWFEWSRDGRQLACSRGTVTSDVVLINNFN